MNSRRRGHPSRHLEFGREPGLQSSVSARLVILALLVSATACDSPAADADSGPPDSGSLGVRGDGARPLVARGPGGSFQNPAWSPESAAVLFTRFREGYNAGPADLLVLTLATGAIASVVSADDGSTNVNLPGSSTTWTSADLVVFSGDREPLDRDEIYTVDASGAIAQVTRTDGDGGRPDGRAFEPSISPDGRWVIFEVHPLSPPESPGVLYLTQAGGVLDEKVYLPITGQTQNARQPVWSPDGSRIVFQLSDNAAEPDTMWDLWIVDATLPASMTPTTPRVNITATADESETDASFSPSGDWIVFSKEPLDATGGIASIYVVAAEPGATPTRVTRDPGYDGAPAWSSDGTRIAFESAASDPDGGPGTDLYVIDAPVPGLDP